MSKYSNPDEYINALERDTLQREEQLAELKAMLERLVSELQDRQQEICQARRQALEEAVRMSCLGCLAGEPLEDDPVLGLVHRHANSRPTQCGAAAIHRLLQRDQQEPKP